MNGFWILYLSIFLFPYYFLPFLLEFLFFSILFRDGLYNEASYGKTVRFSQNLFLFPTEPYFSLRKNMVNYGKRWWQTRLIRICTFKQWSGPNATSIRCSRFRRAMFCWNGGKWEFGMVLDCKVIWAIYLGRFCQSRQYFCCIKAMMKVGAGLMSCYLTSRALSSHFKIFRRPWEHKWVVPNSNQGKDRAERFRAVQGSRELLFMQKLVEEVSGQCCTRNMYRKLHRDNNWKRGIKK